MESLLNLLTTHGPIGVVAAIGFVLYGFERRENKKLAQKIYDLGVKSIEADFDHSKSYDALVRVYEKAMGIERLIGRAVCVGRQRENQ
jgi:hypothetical protein